MEAAEAVMSGEPAAYALCRPPGHHAFADVAGGFCFINNSAVAAQRLRKNAARVAILDVDLHHGNGTQGIFYARPDVLTVSIHADPVRFYPFFWGYADERGEGAGLGYNYNLPLERKSGDAVFLEALEAACKRIEAFAPEALVVALGLDAFEGDPFGGLSVSTPGFARIAEAIAQTRPADGDRAGGRLPLRRARRQPHFISHRMGFCHLSFLCRQIVCRRNKARVQRLSAGCFGPFFHRRYRPGKKFRNILKKVVDSFVWWGLYTGTTRAGRRWRLLNAP